MNPKTHADTLIIWIGRILFLTRCAKCGAPRLVTVKGPK